MEFGVHFLFDDFIGAMKTSQHYWWCDPDKPENNLTVYTYGNVFIVEGWPFENGRFKYFGDILRVLGMEDRLTN
jgi:hypothetical protein